MKIDSFSSSVAHTPVPIERLGSASNLSESEKVAEASRQFEAVLLRQVLSEAQAPVFKSAFVSHSVANDIYRDILTQEMAEQISRSNSLGLGQTLQSQLQQQLHLGQTPPSPNDPEQ